MKKVLLIALCIAAFTACRDTQKDQEMIPVEADGGIGDGAEHPDSIKKYQEPPIINKDTIKDPINQKQ
jgi:hypothetical protein